MISKLLQFILPGFRTERVGSTSPVDSKKAKTTGMDVIHEAIRSDSIELNGLVATGQVIFERKKLKEKIRKKVKSTIVSEFDEADIVEEITDRIMDAAEFDPHYAEMFDDKS